MKRRLLALLCTLASTAALADYVDRVPMFRCDAAASSVSIWFEGQDLPFELRPGGRASALKVPPAGRSGQLSPSGSAYRTPGRSRIQRCGRLRLRLEAAFLNANPDGELGVFEFPAIEIAQGRRVLLPRTGLAVCDDPPSRWEVFGRCPQDFATAIEVTGATASSRARVRVVHARNTPDGDVNRATEDRSVP